MSICLYRHPSKAGQPNLQSLSWRTCSLIKRGRAAEVLPFGKDDALYFKIERGIIIKKRRILKSKTKKKKEDNSHNEHKKK